jgi:hypothetical protein
MADNGRLIMDPLGIGLLDPSYSWADMLDQNSMVDCYGEDEEYSAFLNHDPAAG